MTDLQNIEAELMVILADYSNDLGALKKRDGLLPAQAATQRIIQLCSSRELAGRIDELKKLDNPTNTPLLTKLHIRLLALKKKEK